jgi:Family of unknown function (DUF5946)
MGMPELDRCPGCGALLPRADGPRHPYLGASAGCWRRYGEVLAREFEDPTVFAAAHQLSVDAYAAQHPGQRERRAIQSVAVHLMGLCLWFEHGLDPALGPRFKRNMIRRAAVAWLEPPASIGSLTVLSVLSAVTPDEHVAAVKAWARDVWHAWSVHHQTIGSWLAEACWTERP